MNIKKLTITSINSKNKPLIVEINPGIELAKSLIKDRLSVGYKNDYNIARVFRKLPKNIPSWINPKTKVLNIRKFDTIS